jgi:hypothetical protein
MREHTLHDERLKDMRLQRTRRELRRLYGEEIRSGGLRDPLLVEAYKMAVNEGRALDRDSVTHCAVWIQAQQIAMMKAGVSTAGDQVEQQAVQGVQGAPGEVLGAGEVQEGAGASGMSTERTPGADGHQEHRERLQVHRSATRESVSGKDQDGAPGEATTEDTADVGKRRTRKRRAARGDGSGAAEVDGGLT